MKVNLCDFDKTIYDGDSSIDFYNFCLKKKIAILKHLPKQVLYIFLYKIKKKNKTEMKEVLFSFLKDFNNIDEVIEEFWNKYYEKIKKWYLIKNHSNDIIISASPEFLLKIPCDKLKVKDLIASKVDKKNGKFIGENCYGKEKVRRLKEKYPNIKISNAYSDSMSDYPLFEIASNSYIVKKNNIIGLKNR